MNKNAVKKFAFWARQELLRQVELAAERFAVTGKDDVLGQSTAAGRVLTGEESKSRDALIEAVRRDGWEAVMEEAAYTWFNRFCAVRYMEVNGYLPGSLRVLSGDDGNMTPQILREAADLAEAGELPGITVEAVLAKKEQNDEEGLYRDLFLAECRALGELLPGLFGDIHPYMTLLFPEGLLQKDSFLRRLTGDILEEDWKDAVQIIGWLYQYYNSEKKDQVFAALKKNVKITKDTIPAATQLFTPDWIVRYMGENSLGRLWMESHPESAAALLPSEEERRLFRETGEDSGKWQYYLPEAAQEPEVQAHLDALRAKDAGKTAESLRVIDPCCGSGHILVYLFDMLLAMYREEGWQTRDAVRSIVEHNLYGLDIDRRAAQLSYFAVMMKARQYDRRFLTRRIRPQVYAVPDSSGMGNAAVNLFAEEPALQQAAKTLLEEFEGGKEYGSLLTITDADWEGLAKGLDQAEEESNLFRRSAAADLRPFVDAGRVLAQKYDAVVTNPPYMGSSNMDGVLSAFVKKHYPKGKSDLFAVFMERCLAMTKEKGILAMITQHSWMFLTSFEKLRTHLLAAADIETMSHLGPRAFEEIGGEVVQTTAFTMRHGKCPGYKGIYCRLIGPTTQDGKKELFLEGKNQYTVSQDNFSKIPGSPVAYWVSEHFYDAFLTGERLKKTGDTRQGMATSDNNRFLRLWYEVYFDKVGIGCANSENAVNLHKKWYPYNKGGIYRKWYGNIDYVVNYENDGCEIKEYAKSLYKSVTRTIKSISEYFKSCISWSKISSGDPAFRYYPNGFIFDVAGCCIFFKDANYEYYELGFLNSIVAKSLLSILSPTLNYEAGHIANLPVIYNAEKSFLIKNVIEQNVTISQYDWDSFETSWDFQKSPLLPDEAHEKTLEETYQRWKKICEERFCRLRDNEEELNRIFIDIYGLSDELTPDVAEKDVTVARIYDRAEDIPESMKGNGYVLTKADAVRQFLSYAVGCMMGRYSLDKPGLVYAGGDFRPEKYASFPADEDGILPLTEKDYFGAGDIIGRLGEFLAVLFGKNYVEENLAFLAGALGKGEPREVLRRYFLNDFFKDHCRMYKKRPIYWLFDSGKKNGFKALLYLHRYRADSVARLRTKYLHELQGRYRAEADDLDRRLEKAETNGEKVRLGKAAASLRERREEARLYEEKVQHLADQMISLDLDDGVKVNYARLQEVLAKIR